MYVYIYIYIYTYIYILCKFSTSKKKLCGGAHVLVYNTCVVCIYIQMHTQMYTNTNVKKMKKIEC